MEKTVLLVEDERGLVASLTEEFQFEDYNVMTAYDGEEAVETFHDNLSQIDRSTPKIREFEVMVSVAVIATLSLLIPAAAQIP